MRYLVKLLVELWYLNFAAIIVLSCAYWVYTSIPGHEVTDDLAHQKIAMQDYADAHPEKVVNDAQELYDRNQLRQRQILEHRRARVEAETFANRPAVVR